MEQADAIAVTGATGFIGRHVVARLRAAGHRVVVLTRTQPRADPADPLEWRRFDVAEPIESSTLCGCRVLINLVGIKRETAALGFEVAHVTAPLALADAALAAGLERMIHVSVAGAERSLGPSSGAYLDSKQRGDLALLSRSDALAITIVRPGVVYGRGDDMLHNLADTIRAAPVFPAPRAGRSELAPVAVEDVAEALLRCVERPISAGRCYDVVGPERLQLRDLVARVSAAPSVARRCLVIGVPSFVQVPIAAMFEQWSSDPLVTRAQLRLIREGVVGDPEPAARDLDFRAKPFDVDAIERALEGFVPRLPSIRLVPDPRATRALAELGGDSSPAAVLGFAGLAVAGLLVGPWLIASIWLRMAALNVVLVAVALATMRLRWAALWRPNLTTTVAGVGAGVVMGLGAFAVAAGLARVAPTLWSGAGDLYAWADLLPLGAALALLVIIVAGEEVVWRGVLGLGLAARIGAWPAVLISASLFTLAHVSLNSPLLLVAAALAGGMWTALAIRSRSLWASFCSHLLWDIGLLWVTPLG